MTIDVGSTIVQVHGDNKHGAAYGDTHRLGHHPLLATRAGIGEVRHARLRKGSANSQRGTRRLVEELVDRPPRCGTTGSLSVRADSGFYSIELLRTCDRLGVAYSITVNLNASVKAAIDVIAENAWQKITDTDTDAGEAEVAEFTYVTGSGEKVSSARLVVRRNLVCDAAVQQLFPTRPHHAFVTSVELATVDADAAHRDHATVEHAIRDLKEGADLEQCPLGAIPRQRRLALLRGVRQEPLPLDMPARKGGQRQRPRVACTLRRQLFALPGRLVNRSGKPTRRLPAQSPWPVPSSAPSTALATYHSSPARQAGGPAEAQTVTLALTNAGSHQALDRRAHAPPPCRVAGKGEHRQRNTSSSSAGCANPG